MAIHRKRWTERPWSIIECEGQAAGTVSIQQFADHMRFGEFYLLPQFQGRGLGTRVLRTALGQADSAQLPVRLEYLKWNPVGRLYKRHGFETVSESETHYFMERQPTTG